jgi:hypothetical protein
MKIPTLKVLSENNPSLKVLPVKAYFEFPFWKKPTMKVLCFVEKTYFENAFRKICTLDMKVHPGIDIP